MQKLAIGPCNPNDLHCHLLYNRHKQTWFSNKAAYFNLSSSSRKYTLKFREKFERLSHVNTLRMSGQKDLCYSGLISL